MHTYVYERMRRIEKKAGTESKPFSFVACFNFMFPKMETFVSLEDRDFSRSDYHWLTCAKCLGDHKKQNQYQGNYGRSQMRDVLAFTRMVTMETESTFND